MAGRWPHFGATRMIGLISALISYTPRHASACRRWTLRRAMLGATAGAGQPFVWHSASRNKKLMAPTAAHHAKRIIDGNAWLAAYHLIAREIGRNNGVRTSSRQLGKGGVVISCGNRAVTGGEEGRGSWHCRRYLWLHHSLAASCPMKSFYRHHERPTSS